MGWSYWDRLPEEILDAIVMYTDLDTAILLQRPHCIERFLKRKRNERLLDWAQAAKSGNIRRLKYMMENGINRTHDSCLIHLALTRGHLECAKWLYLHRESIKRLLWKKRHQRIHNHLVTENTLVALIGTGKHQEALWYLDKTYYTFDIKSLFSVTGQWETDRILVERLLEESARMVNSDLSGSLTQQMLLKLLLRDRIRSSHFCIWIKLLRDSSDSCFHLMWALQEVIYCNQTKYNRRY